MNSALEAISSRLTEAEEQMSHLEDGMVEITATEQTTEKRMKRNEDSLRPPGHQRAGTCIMWIPGGERARAPKEVFEEIAEKFPIVGNEIVNQVQEARSPGRDKPKEEHTETHSSHTDKNQRQR